MSKIFGSKELQNCVKNLKFAFHSSNSHHEKYYPPKGVSSPNGVQPFYMIQLGRKAYDPNSCARYISELKKFGFTKDQIEKAIDSK